MKVIIGLGNPGSAYAQTRHNAGALFIQWLVKHKYKPKTTHNTAKYNLFTINQNLHLCIPLTFMNISGQAVHSLTRKFPVLNAKDILVVHDDLEHKVGNVRIKDGGSAQGHNGVQSIIRQLRTNSFKRLQLGIARPQSRDPQIVAKYVLSKFRPQQLSKFIQCFPKAIQISKQHQYL